MCLKSVTAISAKSEFCGESVEDCAIISVYICYVSMRFYFSWEYDSTLKVLYVYISYSWWGKTCYMLLIAFHNLQ